MMDATTYINETARTWNADDGHRLQLCNAALGLVGEVGELIEKLDAVASGRGSFDVATEAGDVWYYLMTLYRLLGVDASDAPCYRATMAKYSEASLRDHTKVLAYRAAESAKKHVFHGKDDAQLIRNLRSFEAGFAEMTMRIGLMSDDLWQQNIDKLRERHPTGWSTEYVSE